MPTYGEYKRAKPVLVVKRGFDPNQPKAGTTARRVKAGVTILSGQVISQVLNVVDSVLEWELGWVAGRIPFLALEDSTDSDVVSANKLVGYSCLGDFVLQTAYLKTGETFLIDSPVGPDGVTGNLKVATAESGEPIMGYVVDVPHDLLVGQNGYPAISAVEDGEVLAFQTGYVANTADAT